MCGLMFRFVLMREFVFFFAKTILFLLLLLCVSFFCAVSNCFPSIIWFILRSFFFTSVDAIICSISSFHLIFGFLLWLSRLLVVPIFCFFNLTKPFSRFLIRFPCKKYIERTCIKTWLVQTKDRGKSELPFLVWPLIF